jgi:DNA-directed RNA polymerase subunit RPC12/RpoP
VHAHPTPGTPPFEINSIFRTHGPRYRTQHHLTREQHRVVNDIERCRTSALGGHLYRCTHCAADVSLYNSCLNRHCPTCQGPAQLRWVEQRKQRLLSTDYFHLVFTLPAALRPLAHRCRRPIFDLLFAAAAHTLLALGRDPKRLGATIGFTLVLHTWKRDLLFHPHVHGIVSGGGLDLKADRWVATRQNYLFPGKVLSRVFRGKFLAGLIDLYNGGALGDAALDPSSFRTLIASVRTRDWVVFAKRPFGGPEQIVRYLGLYTHRVALSNTRLLDVRDDRITFRTRGAGTCSIPPDDFIHRFLLHVLPDRFVKIRHYGLLAPANVNTHLKRAQQLLSPQPRPQEIHQPEAQADHLAADPEQTSSKRLPRCPHCGRRALIRVAATHRSAHHRRSDVPRPDT